MQKRTPLFEQHRLCNASMVQFAGWEMPLHYGSQLEEHQHVRRSAGLFDVSHMAVVDIKGRDTKDYLRKILANSIDKLKAHGKALYSCMLNDKGGVIDDLICFLLDDAYARLVVNAATTDSDLAWLREQGASFAVDIVQQNCAMLAFQGPQARSKIAATLTPEQRTLVEQMAVFDGQFCQGAFIARTGYTGEDGIEVIVAPDAAVTWWQRGLQAGFAPCGLGARDTLRLEAGLNLYGQDMDTRVTPLNANLAWTVSFDGDRAFIGREALEKQREQGVDMQLVGLILLDKGILRHGQHVRTAAREDAGVVTSGSYSPTLGRSIALARLHVPIASTCSIQVRQRWLNAQVVKPPFVRHGQIKVSIAEEGIYE